MNKKDLLKMFTVDNFIILLLLSILTYLVVNYTQQNRFTNPKINHFKNKSRHLKGFPRRNIRERFYNSNQDNGSIDFYLASWCGYCNKAKPDIKKLFDGAQKTMVTITEDGINKQVEKPLLPINYQEDGELKEKQFILNEYYCDKDAKSKCDLDNIRGYPTVKVTIGNETHELRLPITVSNIKQQIKILLEKQ